MKKTLTGSEVRDGAPLPAGSSHELTVPSIITGARLPLIFKRFRSFPEPSCLAMLERVRALMIQDATMAAVVLGHSDTFGDGGPNKKLSKARAEAVVALLSDDVEYLVSQFSLADENEAWGVTEAVDMMTCQGVDDFPSLPSEETDEISRFQAEQGLSVSGLLDGATIEATVKHYLSLLGSPRPKKDRFRELAGGSAQKVLPLGANQQVSEDPESVDFVHPRRAELFLFQGLVFPDPSTFSEGSSSTEPTYEEWCKRCSTVLETDTGALRIRFTDQRGVPLGGRRVDLFPALDDDDDPAPLASATTDGSGVARFANRIGAFSARVESKFDQELIVHPRTKFPNRYERRVTDFEGQSA